jgi:predicted ATPase
LDVDGWLREIGLGQYAQTFRDNAINADMLRKAIGEPPADPLLLFLLLTGYVVSNGVAGNVKACRDVATSILSLAEKQQASAPLVLGHICVGYSLLLGGEIREGKAHLDQTIALYDPAEHRLLHFGIDPRVSALVWRSNALWMLGYPEAARADADRAVKDARAIGHAPSLMIALSIADLTHMLCGNYAAGSERINELVGLADEIGGAFWKLAAAAIRGRHLALIGNAENSIPLMIATRNAYEATGANFLAPLDLAILGSTHATLGKFDDARRYVADAMNSLESNKERWFEAEVNRVAGEIALMPPKPDATKAETYLERALAVARQQQAKSWELRAATGLARLWRSQGKTVEARDLLAPVYEWFTEGFETRDLKEAKALLEELA